MSEPLVRVNGLHKSFQTGDGTIEVLRGIDFEMQPGECVAIVGSSGVGKSTLLHILGTLDHPTSGTVEFRGEDLFVNSSDELARFRSDCLGFIFQFHHLLPEFNALENVMMPGLIANEPPEPLRERAVALLGEVGLSHRVEHPVGRVRWCGSPHCYSPTNPPEISTPRRATRCSNCCWNSTAPIRVPWSW
jgi:lipoprotein-releasing system ATP-binding protein